MCTWVPAHWTAERLEEACIGISALHDVRCTYVLVVGKPLGFGRKFTANRLQRGENQYFVIFVMLQSRTHLWEDGFSHSEWPSNYHS